jgi:hypothetical protein
MYNNAALRDGNSGEGFDRALMNAPRSTPTKWVFKFDTEGERYDYDHHDSERFNGLPYADILNFDNKIRSNCGEEFYMQPIIASKNAQKIGGIAFFVVFFMLSLALMVLYDSEYKYYGIFCGIFGLLIGSTMFCLAEEVAKKKMAARKVKIDEIVRIFNGPSG